MPLESAPAATCHTVIEHLADSATKTALARNSTADINVGSIPTPAVHIFNVPNARGSTPKVINFNAKGVQIKCSAGSCVFWDGQLLCLLVLHNISKPEAFSNAGGIQRQKLALKSLRAYGGVPFVLCIAPGLSKPPGHFSSFGVTPWIWSSLCQRLASGAFSWAPAGRSKGRSKGDRGDPKAPVGQSKGRSEGTCGRSKG